MNTRSFALAFALTLVAADALAQSSSQQQVTVAVREIATIAVQGNVSMTISQATPGQNPDAVSANSSYDVSTNGEDRKITVELDENMPSGLTLQAQLAAPTGASSTGAQVLSTQAKNAVTGITRVRGSGLAITYTATATVEVASDSYARTVTYTITNN